MVGEGREGVGRRSCGIGTGFVCISAQVIMYAIFQHIVNPAVPYDIFCHVSWWRSFFPQRLPVRCSKTWMQTQQTPDQHQKAAPTRPPKTTAAARLLSLPLLPPPLIHLLLAAVASRPHCIPSCRLFHHQMYRRQQMQQLLL